MSGIGTHTLIEKAVLRCEVCPARWESSPYTPTAWLAEVIAARPAFDAGWRVYVGKRSQYTYCPEHGPKAAMTQIYPREDR